MKPLKTRTRNCIVAVCVLLSCAEIAATIMVVNNHRHAQDIMHDRVMVKLIGENAEYLLLTQPIVVKKDGPVLADRYYAAPQNFCESLYRQGPDPGCISAMTHEPLGMSETDQHEMVKGIGTDHVAGIGVEFNDLTISQCKSLLAGGTQTIGSAGANIGMVPPKSLPDQVAVDAFCTASARNGLVSDLYVDFSPDGRPWTFN